MRNREWLLGLVLLGVGWPGLVVGGEPDPEEVRRRMEKYEWEAAEEAAKSAPKPKPKPRPTRETTPVPAPAPRPKPSSVSASAPKVDHDREAWKSAEKCGTAACFEAYLEDYPKGRYAKMARARLKTEPMPSSAPPSPSSQAEADDLARAAAARAEAYRAAAARAEAYRAAAARPAAAEAARTAATIELQSKPMTPAPTRTLVIPTLPANTPKGGSVVGSYALQENAYAVRNYYRSQNVRAEVERIMVNYRPVHQVRVWR